MYILIIDTSTTRPLVVITCQGRPVFSKELPVGHQSSKYLASALQEGFSSLKITTKNLRAVAVTVGPGSFTGIRVGVALAKGICLGQNLPLISLCSLKGLISRREGPFMSLIDARGGGAYILRGNQKKGKISFIGLPERVPLEKLQFKGPVVTPDALNIKGKFSSSVDWIEKGADPFYLAYLAEEKFQKKEYSENCGCFLIYSTYTHSTSRIGILAVPKPRA